MTVLDRYLFARQQVSAAGGRSIRWELIRLRGLLEAVKDVRGHPRGDQLDALLQVVDLLRQSPMIEPSTEGECRQGGQPEEIADGEADHGGTPKIGVKGIGNANPISLG